MQNQFTQKISYRMNASLQLFRGDTIPRRDLLKSIKE